MIAIFAYLFVLAFYVVLAAISIPYVLFKAIIRGVRAKSFKVYWNIMWEWVFKSAWGLDQAGSPLLSHLGNDLMVKPNGVRLGSPDKTLSHYLGINKVNGTLYLFGKVIAFIVDAVAYLMGDKNHTTKAANAEQFNK